MKKWGLAFAGLFIAAAVAFSIVSLTDNASAQEGKGDKSGRYEEVLAQKLGISVDQLHTYQKAAFDQVIDEAVQRGDLTADQGAKLKEHGPGKGGLALRAKAKMAVGAVQDVFGAAASAIGITPQQLRTEMGTDNSIAEVAQSHGVSRPDLEAKMTDAVKKHLAEAVANKRLTQPQADKLLSAFDSRLDNLLDHEGGVRPLRDGMKRPPRGSTP